MLKAKYVFGFPVNVVCTIQPGIITQLTQAAEERPWLWVVYILTVGLPIGLVVLFCWPKVLPVNQANTLFRVAAISQSHLLSSEIAGRLRLQEGQPPSGQR